tara:strand:- start:594 stop:1256 length:663 start_codon:yes stop_codon:yes gene_type:complete
MILAVPIGLFVFAALVGVSIFAGKLAVGCFQGELSSWVQAFGSIGAIVTGFGAAFWQVASQSKKHRYDQNSAILAAYTISHEAIEYVSKRLDTALTPEKDKVELSLQGDRTSEMVLAMREFNAGLLPAEQFQYYVLLRSHVYAINERISEVYESEVKNARSREERPKRLNSSIQVLTDTRSLFKKYQDLKSVKHTNGFKVLGFKERDHLNNASPNTHLDI